MTVVWFNSKPPETRFAPYVSIPIYVNETGTPKDLNARLRQQMLAFEDHVKGEELATEVKKAPEDTYAWTQHWKQHNLFFDAPVMATEHLERFPMTDDLTEFLGMIRREYLLFLRELGYPREIVYIHAWANILRKDEYISFHYHSSEPSGYLSGTYYLTTNDTTLDLLSPVKFDHKAKFPTKEGNIVMFPSYINHACTRLPKDELRFSVAFDICTAYNVEMNPWRSYHLFDDPDTMPGLD
jgi:hypothetical protein